MPSDHTGGIAVSPKSYSAGAAEVNKIMHPLKVAPQSIIPSKFLNSLKNSNEKTAN